jgi:hypothetical protein
MPHAAEILEILGILLAAVMLILVVRARQRGKAAHDTQYANENVCEHLKRALDHLEAHGHRVYKVGQHGPDFPLEIHMEPPFDPAAVYKELQLEPPVHVSERNVLYCKDDWCEIHPLK